MQKSDSPRKIKRIVVGIYVDPDFFPPTINAILNFADVSEEVVVISRNNNFEDYPFPSNVRLKKIGRLCSVRDMENQSIALKTWGFLQFTFCLTRFSVFKKCSLLVLYDSIALFSFFLSKAVPGKRKVWYHNHDIPLKEFIKKRSIGGLSATYEERAMRYVNFFSLPSRERLQFYPNVRDSIQVFVIPNYPSLKVYKNAPFKSKTKPFKIIYQGFIGTGRGLEKLIKFVASYKKNDQLRLIIKGSVTDVYKKELDHTASLAGISDQVTWVPVGPYKKLMELTASCNMGIGIKNETDINSLNQGTASNKIYEYAASGLPVIVYDNEQFRNYLDQYDWVFFSDGSVESFCGIINEIRDKTDELGKQARESFERELNFEKVFLPVLEKVMATITIDKGN